MSLDHDQETHKAIDRGSWEDAIEHAKKVPANYDIWQRLPSAHERGMPDHAINMALDELTDPYSKNKKNINSFLFELASKLHHPSVTPETVRRVAQLGVDNGDHYVENQATHHPKFSHDTSSKDALKAAKFWRSYEIAVDPHHFAAVKSMYSGQPESAVDHRGKYGKSHGKAFIHSGVIKTDPEINSQGKFQLVSEAIPHLQGHAKKIQDKILKDDDIKKRVINGKAHVKLYRGINGNYGKSIKEAVGHNPETHEVDKKTLVLRSAPFSSWTTDHNIASNFAWHRSEIPGQEGNNGVVLSKWIPIDNILHSGTHRVIAGSDWNPHPHENEFVVGHPEGKLKISTNNLYFQPKDNVYGEGALITPKNYGEVHQAKVRKDELIWDGFDDLEKNDREREEPPTQVGQQHPTKPYVSKRHVTGETTWYYNPQASRANDNYIENNKEQYLRYFPAEHQPVVRSFIDHIANSPTRHAVVSRDQIGGQNQLRARHLKNLMSGSFDVNMKVLDPSTIHISAYRHGRGNPTHNWLYIKGKGLSEETFKSESDSDDLFKVSDDWKHEGYQISHSMHIDPSSKKNPTDGDYIHINAHSPEGKHVGNAKLYLYDKTLYPSVVDVDKKHQRKGLATAMYQHAEKVTGKKLEPGEQSIQGEALWAQKDRPFGKSEDLDKSMKHKIAALSTVASLLGVPYSTATAQQDMPKVVEQAPVTPSEDLKPISYIESRNGANQNHQKVTWGLNAGSKAIGMYGFMPVEAQETIKYDPALTSKYGHLLQYHPIKEAHKIESFLLKNPNVQHEMANSHWNHLKKIFSKNKDRAVYAWKNGIKGAYEATRQEVENHPYVKEYHKFNKLLKLQKHPTTIHKPLSVKKSEDLEKMGAARRLHGKFDPLKELPEDQAKRVSSWIGGHGNRDKVPVLSTGGKFRTINKLMNRTKWRKNTQTNEREFLLHRQMSGDELDNTANLSNGTISHTNTSSWTPDFARVQEGIYKPHDAASLRDYSRIASAWIPESKIKTYIPQYGAHATASSKAVKPIERRGPSGARDEQEVIIGPHTSQLHTVYADKRDKFFQENDGSDDTGFKDWQWQKIFDKLNKFSKSEQEEHAFQKPHFILSAENPLYLEHQKMKMSTEELSRHLSSIGEDHEIVQGHYGNPEKSIVVKNPKDVPHLHKLASDLGQESAIYSNGHQHEMHYYHGANKGKVVHGEGTTIHQDRPSDYYTTMHQNGQPVHFTHHFDFGKSEDLEKSELRPKANPPKGFLPVHPSDIDAGLMGMAGSTDARDSMAEAVRNGRYEHLPLANLSNYHLFHGESIDQHSHGGKKYFDKYPEMRNEPPIAVKYSDGYHIVDGQHRFNQAIQDGKTHIHTFVVDGDEAHKEHFEARHNAADIYANKKSETEFPDLIKSKNVREQRKKVFGTRANPSLGSPMREKHIEHINNFAKKFLNLEIQPSGGKIDAKTGQRRSADPKVGIDKPDWRSGQLESQWNPEAIIHELAHLMLLPPGVGLAEGQRLMDKTYGDLQSKYGYQQQKRAQAEVQPMAAEQIIRRHLGLPASRVNIPVESKDAPQRVSVEDPNIVIATRVPQKTRSGETKYIDLIRQSKFLHPENKQRLEDIFSGKLTFHPEAGWLPKKSDSIPKDHTESLQGGPQKLVASEQEDLEKAPLHYDIDDTDNVSLTPYSNINKLVARNKFKEGEHRVYVNPKDSTDFVHTLHIPGVRGPVAQLHVQERYQDDIGETEPTVSHSVVSPKHKGHGYGKFLYRQAIKHHKILTSDQTVSGRANKMWNKLHNKDIATDIAEFGDDPTPHRAMYIGKSEELEKAISPEEAEQQGYKLKHLTTAHGHLAGAKLYHKGEVVGHIHYSPQSNKEGYHKILNSDIEPEHRGKGLYQYMIQSIHDKVKSEGARGVMSEGYQRSSDATNAWEKIATHKKDSGHPVYVGIKQPDGSYKNELRHKPVIDYYLGKSEGDVLYHYSQHSEPLNLIHPEKQGEGMAGQEKKRVGRIPRSYYYDTPDNHESIVTQGAKHMYTVKHPGKILDVASPEALHVKEKARNPYGIVEPDALEEQVKAHGYHGYKNSASSNPNIVAVFKPLEVHSSTKLIKSDNSEYESESLMKAEFDPAEDVHSFTATNGSEEDMNESYKIDQFLKDDKTHKLQHKGLFTHDSFIAGTSPEDAWLIKVESGTVPGIQAIKHTGPQPVKEAAFYHIAKDIFGLGKFIPRAILGTIEKGSERKWAAAIKMLPPQYKLAAPMDSEHHGAIKGILQKYNLSGVTHMLAFLLYVLGDLDSHGNNYMTDGHEIRLIDHGSSFANEKSEDRSDKKMFIPYILRRDGYKHNMSANEKISYMPTIPTIDVAHKLKNYVLSIDPQKLYQQIKEFGLDPKASVARLRVVQHMVRLSEHPDNVINFLWVKGAPEDLFQKYLGEHADA